MARTRAICFSSAVIVATLLGTFLYAQTPAAPERPGGVPNNYVMTPNGYFHPSCVREVRKGEILLRDRHGIQHADGSIEIISVCQYPRYTSRGEIISAGTEPPTIGHQWIEYASTTTGTSFGELTANWVVPPAPAANDSQIVYFFPGMEDINDVISILQPVLQYGNNGYFGGNYWVIASWNCCVSGTTYYSTPVEVNPGDLLLGTIRSTCAAGVLSCATWNVTTEDETLLTSTTLGDSGSDGQTFNWAFAGALEVSGITQCGDFPPNGRMYFFDEGLYDYNFNQITNPGWSITPLFSGLTPQCSYGGVVDGSTEVTLDYGTPPSCSGCLVLNYYDQVSTGFTSDNIHVSNFGTSEATAVIATPFGTQELAVPADSDEHTDFIGGRDGPVFISGPATLTASQRVLYYSSFSEVYAQSSAAASTQLWLNWYDKEDPGFNLDNIHLANPSGIAVTATVTLESIRRTLTVPPYGVAYTNFPAVGGPVSITASAPILASARTEYYESFNEVNAVPVSQASTQLQFNWYDLESPGFTQDYVHIGNPGTSSATVTIKLAGVVKDVATVAANSDVYVSLGNLSGGPVAISSTVPVIASQRVFYYNSFNEVYAVPASQATTALALNWYDNYDTGFTEYVHVSNPSVSTATVTVKLGTSTHTVTVPAGGATYVNFAGEVGGPVFITSNVPILASGRTEYKQSFNEVNAVPEP